MNATAELWSEVDAGGVGRGTSEVVNRTPPAKWKLRNDAAIRGEVPTDDEGLDAGAVYCAVRSEDSVTGMTSTGISKFPLDVLRARSGVRTRPARPPAKRIACSRFASASAAAKNAPKSRCCGRRQALAACRWLQLLGARVQRALGRLRIERSVNGRVDEGDRGKFAVLEQR